MRILCWVVSGGERHTLIGVLNARSIVGERRKAGCGLTVTVTPLELDDHSPTCVSCTVAGTRAPDVSLTEWLRRAS